LAENYSFHDPIRRYEIHWIAFSDKGSFRELTRCSDSFAFRLFLTSSTAIDLTSMYRNTQPNFAGTILANLAGIREVVVVVSHFLLKKQNYNLSLL